MPPSTADGVDHHRQKWDGQGAGDRPRRDQGGDRQGAEHRPGLDLFGQRHRTELGCQAGPHPSRDQQARQHRAKFDHDGGRQEAGQGRLDPVGGQQAVGLEPGDEPDTDSGDLMIGKLPQATRSNCRTTASGRSPAPGIALITWKAKSTNRPKSSSRSTIPPIMLSLSPQANSGDAAFSGVFAPAPQIFGTRQKQGALRHVGSGRSIDRSVRKISGVHLSHWSMAADPRRLLGPQPNEWLGRPG